MKELHPEFEGTIVERLNNIDIDDFNLTGKGQAPPTYLVIGELTGYEKCCITLRRLLLQEHKEMVDKESEHSEEPTLEHHAIHIDIDLVEEMLNASIQRRLPQTVEHDFGLWGVKIALFPPPTSLN